MTQNSILLDHIKASCMREIEEILKKHDCSLHLFTDAYIEPAAAGVARLIHEVKIGLIHVAELDNAK